MSCSTWIALDISRIQDSLAADAFGFLRRIRFFYHGRRFASFPVVNKMPVADGFVSQVWLVVCGTEVYIVRSFFREKGIFV